MNTTNNTILITGGSAGIGFAIAQRLGVNNHVIITGRNEQRLKAAAAKLSNATAIAGDITDASDAERLAGILRRDHPELNLVINNAGMLAPFALTGGNGAAFEKAQQEMLTNYLSVVRLNDALLPLLRLQPAAAIVNVTSIVAFVPRSQISTYSATKAALRSYTLSLRHQLASTSDVKVFELMPPLVDTEFSDGIGGKNGIAPSVVADALAAALEKDQYEIRVAGTEDLYQLYRSSPESAFEALNSVRQPA
ncbi:MAG TPA: SDR family NAD(P)-dependent oxidoreductase [Puia sp.]|jgi:uncharacterized oxidoreductase|nr:SDR family NAD(P)-dependent oxidoreductase [Puia sp.]